MEKHEIDRQAKWLHIKYDGEDRDDECVNELSIYQNADELSCKCWCQILILIISAMIILLH